MYEDHIRRLQMKLTGSGDEELHAAISMMRAAEPKSEGEERAWCERFVLEMDNAKPLDCYSAQDWIAKVQEARALARAESAAELLDMRAAYDRLVQSMKGKMAKQEAELLAVKGQVTELRDMLGRAGAVLEAHVPQHSINPLIAELLDDTK